MQIRTCWNLEMFNWETNTFSHQKPVIKASFLSGKNIRLFCLYFLDFFYKKISILRFLRESSNKKSISSDRAIIYGFRFLTLFAAIAVFWQRWRQIFFRRGADWKKWFLLKCWRVKIWDIWSKFILKLIAVVPIGNKCEIFTILLHFGCLFSSFASYFGEGPPPSARWNFDNTIYIWSWSSVGTSLVWI